MNNDIWWLNCGRRLGSFSHGYTWYDFFISYDDVGDILGVMTSIITKAWWWLGRTMKSEFPWYPHKVNVNINEINVEWWGWWIFNGEGISALGVQVVEL